jgi:hypothetical protein
MLLPEPLPTDGLPVPRRCATYRSRSSARAQPAVVGTAPFARHNAVHTQVARPHRARTNQYKLMVADT